MTPDLCLGKIHDEVSLAPALALAAGDGAVGGPLMLDREHDPLVGLIGECQRFGDDAVETGSLKLVEPSPGGRQVGGRWGDVHCGVGKYRATRRP